MAQLKTRHVRGFRRGGAEPPASGRRCPGAVRWAAAAALGLLSACFSPEAYTEHLCRTCDTECPDGLTCHNNRCVPECDSSCVGDYKCDDGACVPISGAETCPTSSISLALCVGQANDSDLGAEMSSEASADEPWVVLHAQLPDGVVFDPDTGKLSGTPSRAEPGSLTVRHGEPGSEELNVELLAIEQCVSIDPAIISWCRGKDESYLLGASPPGQYEWRLASASAPGISLQGAALVGKLDELGSYQVRVELIDSGTWVDTETIELEVRDCGAVAPPDLVPQPLEISTLAALPVACEGIEYGADFAATGGQGDYHWTLETELAGLALDEASGRLTGKPLASGDFELSVSVEDSAGQHDTMAAGLHVGNAEECATGPLTPTEEEACAVGTPATCPRAPLRIATTDLGVACAGEEFSARLAATGGGGNYDWHLTDAAPSGLELERTGELHGVPLDAGEYRIAVWLGSALNGPVVYGSVTLEIVSCDALVFLAAEPGADRLYHANPGSGVVNELSDGVLGTGEQVHSFALSADGAHLAFDVTSENAPGRLYWVDLATFEARQPTFAPELPDEASLIDYRWSPDGSQLAATYRSGGEVFLGVSPAAGGAGASVNLTGRYRSSLFWAAERICYVAPGLQSPFLTVLCQTITPEGIDDQTPAAGIFDPSELRTDLLLGNDEGYLALLTDEVGQFIVPGGLESSARHRGRVFSPGLHGAAGPSAGDASIFDVFTSRGTPSEPTLLAQLDPCDKLDAWSFDERTIACRSGDSLAIHQLGPDGALAGSSIVEDSAGYLEEEFRRLLAPGGQWYAYDAGNELRVVALDATPPRSRSIVEGVTQGLYAGLGTDPSGAHLYYHHGSDLEVIDARADFQVRKVNGDVLLSDPPPCNEAQFDDGPRVWCGAQSIPSLFFPAPGAAFVAFVDRQNQLYVADTETSSAPEPAPRLVHASSVKCTMDSGETACDNFVQWVPRREPK